MYNKTPEVTFGTVVFHRRHATDLSLHTLAYCAGVSRKTNRLWLSFNSRSEKTSVTLDAAFLLQVASDRFDG